MKNRILPLLLAFCIYMALLPLSALAATPLDPHAEASLTLRYQKDGVSFEKLPIRIYRVAEAFPNGSFQLIAPYADYPIHIHGITAQEQWNQVSQTLSAYIVADKLPATCEEATDKKGTVCFSGLTTGLYFVEEVVAENESGTYLFNQFMVYVPTPQPDGSYTYAVEAVPKCIGFVPVEEYSVTKLWQDDGGDHHRPNGVTVEIYKDGQLWETQLLNSANNWNYTWRVSAEDSGKWTVVERSVDENYKVTIQQKDGHFSLINTRISYSDVPKTGDSFSPLLWAVVMCLSGILLVMLSTFGRRRR